jgi:multidrug resistance protein, MATE family
MRGLGKTWHSSFAAAISYYVVAIPLEAVLAFKLGMGLFGLWVG